MEKHTQSKAVKSQGQTERHVQTVKPGKSNSNLLIGLGIAILLLIGLGMMGTKGGEVAPAKAEKQAKPQPETKPVTTRKRDTQDGNTFKVNGSNSGAVINGDNNRTRIDNSRKNTTVIQKTTVIHHHHHTTQVQPQAKPNRILVRAESNEVSAECEIMMAEHFERKAAMYRMIAKHKN